MKIELSAKTAKAFVKGVENMTDMILLNFSKAGIKTRTLKSDNTALLDLEIPKASSEVYEFDNENPVEVALLIADVKDMTKSLVVKDTLMMEYNLDDPTWLILSANGVEKRVRCKNASLMKRHKVPPTESKWSADIPFKQTKAFLTTCKDTPTFEVSVNHGEGIQFQSKNDEETLTMELTHDEVNLHPEESQTWITNLTPSNLLSLLSVASAKTVITLKGSHDAVIKAEWKEAGLILNGWIAPRTA